VPKTTKDFEITLSSSAPNETAIGNLYDADNNLIAKLRTVEMDTDRRKINCDKAQNGFWKLSLKKAEKGRFEDVYIFFGRELSGYASLEADKLLIIK
jgi:hypothetical protein